MIRTRRPSSARRRLAGALVALTAALCSSMTVPAAHAAQLPERAPDAAVARTSPGGASVVTWAASADRQGAGPADRSYRLVVRTSVGGSDLRVRLSNAFGDHPVTFTEAYAGLQRDGAELVRGSNRRLRFGGSPSVTVPAGASVLSDPLPGRIAPMSNLVVSLYVTGAEGPTTGHGMALQTSYAAAGDHAAEEDAAHWTDPIGSWYWLDSVSVRAPDGTGAVAALGDSITDGWASSTDENRRWPDYLARRLGASPDATVKGVANEGISGNKVLADGAGLSALHRYERDVLSQPGVRTVFLYEGINDIKAHTGVGVDDMIAGYRELTDRAHAAGKCVVGATVTPFKGWSEYDDAAESVRQGVNAYLRSSGDLDAVTDFDRILRSPYDRQRMLPVFDSGDHLHPNDKGMQAMADAVDLASLECDRT